MSLPQLEKPDLSRYGSYIAAYTDNGTHQTRNFGAGAAFHGGNFSHTNGDAYYYGGDTKSEKSTEQKLTDALAACLALDGHTTDAQQKSNTEFEEALQHYFRTKSMKEYRRLSSACRQYQTSHQYVGQIDLRYQIFDVLNGYIMSDDEKERQELSDELLKLASRYQSSDMKNQTKSGLGDDRISQDRILQAQA